MSQRIVPIAFCGNDCGACPRYAATQSGDENRLHQVAELWHRLGFRESVVSIKEIRCTGCTPTQKCRHGIAACASKRHLTTCGECRDFTTCVKLAAAFEKTEAFARACETSCDDATCAVLHRAFFRKRENLQKIRQISC